jgi:PAS domain-containing protein
MELAPYFKSVLEQDREPVVICGSDHTIIYVNPAAAEHYAKYGGYDIVGKSIFYCHNARSVELIKNVTDWFQKDPANNLVRTFYSEKQSADIYMVALRDDSGGYIGYYEKHETRRRDDMPLYNLK